MGDRDSDQRSGRSDASDTKDGKGAARSGHQTELTSSETIPASDKTLPAADDVSDQGDADADGEDQSTSLTPEAPHRYRFRGGRSGAELGRGRLDRLMESLKDAITAGTAITASTAITAAPRKGSP